MMHVLFLGTGTSTGVPQIGCSCPVCMSDDPRNKRLRVSVFVQLDSGFHILVDTTPDLRQQALRHGITRVDAVLFTHAHADHIFGMDDLRKFNRSRDHELPCYGDRDTIESIEKMFGYSMNHQWGGAKPLISTHTVASAFELGGIEIVPVPLRHGATGATGYRMGPFAYLTDCNDVPETSYELVTDLDVLVLDALRHKPHPTHFSISEALKVIERINPRRALLTHLAHDVDHETVSRSLPPTVELAYDGLELHI